MWFCSASVCRLGFCYIHIWKTGELKSFLYRSFCKSSSLPPCPPVLTKWRRVGELWIDNRQKGFLGWPGKSEGLSRLSMRPATGKWVTYPGNQNKIRPEAARATRCGAGSRGPKGRWMGVLQDGVSGNTWNRYIKGQDHLNCRKDSTVNGGLADWKAGVWARFPALVCRVAVVEFLARGRATQLPRLLLGKQLEWNTSSVFSVSLDSRRHVSQTPELLALPPAPCSLRHFAVPGPPICLWRPERQPPFTAGPLWFTASEHHRGANKTFFIFTPDTRGAGKSVPEVRLKGLLIKS